MSLFSVFHLCIHYNIMILILSIFDKSFFFISSNKIKYMLPCKRTRCSIMIHRFEYIVTFFCGKLQSFCWPPSHIAIYKNCLVSEASILQHSLYSVKVQLYFIKYKYWINKILYKDFFRLNVKKANSILVF